MTSGLAGMVNASLEVARRLQASGHRVTYACPHEVKDQVEPHGIDYRQLAPINRQPAPLRARQAGESRVSHKLAEWSTRSSRRAEGVLALGMDAFRSWLAELAPDLALVDFDLEEHAITCSTANVRTVMLSQWFDFRKQRGLPPLGSKLEQGSAAQRWLAWTSQRLRSRANAASVYLRYFGTDRRGVVTEYARRSGFPTADLWGHDWSTLFAFDSAPVWSMTAAELDFPHVRRASFTHIGPMVRMDRTETATSQAFRDALKDIVQQAKDAGKRLLYASLTSMDLSASGSMDFAERLVRAAGTRADWTLVLGLGGSEEALSELVQRLGGKLPAQVTPMLWAPQLAALRHADLFISHGGIHSIHEALATATPIVVYSGSAFDQDGCAARLAFHGAASVGSRKESAAEIAARLASALTSEPLRAKAHELQSLFARYDDVLDASLAAQLDAGRAAPPHSPA